MMTNVLVPRRSAVSARRASRYGLACELDRMFDEIWRGVAAPVGRSAPAHFAPHMDVSESEAEFRIAAELPGVEQDDIEVTLEDGTLTIKGERKDDREENEAGLRRVETQRGSFRRSIRLPEEVDQEAVKARYHNGVLELSLPKLPEAKPEVRKIPITTS
jgi:HSP20 family protein